MVKRYFDVNVFVYYLTTHPNFVDKARFWINDTDEIYTSEITFYQLVIIISHLTKENEEEIMRKIGEALSNLGVRFIHIEPNELTRVYEYQKLQTRLRRLNSTILCA